MDGERNMGTEKKKRVAYKSKMLQKYALGTSPTDTCKDSDTSHTQTCLRGFTLSTSPAGSALTHLLWSAALIENMPEL